MPRKAIGYLHTLGSTLRDSRVRSRGHGIGQNDFESRILLFSIVQDSKEYVKKNDQCQQQRDIFNYPSTYLHVLTSHQPYLEWLIDILGPSVSTPNQLKYLIVTVNYFTK